MDRRLFVLGKRDEKFCRIKKSVYICNPNRQVVGRVMHAEIAQLVERNLAKVEVAGPSPVFRSPGQKKGRAEN